MPITDEWNFGFVKVDWIMRRLKSDLCVRMIMNSAQSERDRVFSEEFLRKISYNEVYNLENCNKRWTVNLKMRSNSVVGNQSPCAIQMRPECD